MAPEQRPRPLAPVTDPAPAADLGTGTAAEPGSGMPANEPLPSVSSRLQEDMEAALRREQHRLRRSLQEATARLTDREAALDARARDLDARERRIAETLQSTREMGVRIEAEARANAARIVNRAQRTADRMAEDSRELYEEFERAMRRAEADTAEIHDGALEEAARLRETAHREAQARIESARRQAEEIVQDAWRNAQEQSDRVVELLRLREGLMASLGATVNQFDQALKRAARDEPPVVVPADDLVTGEVVDPAHEAAPAEEVVSPAEVVSPTEMATPADELPLLDELKPGEP